jgi:polyvinyl alcohol dehydrogenase (cytochrome)
VQASVATEQQNVPSYVSGKLVLVAALVIVLAGTIFIVSKRHHRKPSPPNGKAIFNHECTSCHRANSGSRAPVPAVLRQMSQAHILQTLETGLMKDEGKQMKRDERLAVAQFLGRPDMSADSLAKGVCPRDLDPPPDAPAWHGWGVDIHNTRFQPGSVAGLTVDQVPNLKLKWAFGFPGAYATFGQPTSYAGTLFVGSEDGTVYSIDAATGCTWWTFKASATVKTAISIGNNGQAAFFGDTNGNVYALSVSGGNVIWKVRPESHPQARITGSPVLVKDRLYVPISSGEEGAAVDPHYPCCTFRGSLVALDSNTGKQIWKAYTIQEPAKLRHKTASGAQFWGPSGAAVWSAPTIDLKRRAIYVATGNDYSDPASTASDAVIAFDLDSGKFLWSHQLTANDLWNIACVAEDKTNCPSKRGNDFDFGAPPLLRRTPGKGDVLLAAQKSGIVYALDPDRNGQIIWQKRLAHGGPLGGIQWGGAADARYVYYPISDWQDSSTAGGGLYALKLKDGSKAWYVPPAKPDCASSVGCSAAQMAPPTLIPGVLFSGSLDGHLRAYSTKDGTVLWDFNTLQDFQTVNGASAHGGSLNGSGPTVAGGMVFVNAGYTNAIAGNVLLAFSVSDDSQ